MSRKTSLVVLGLCLIYWGALAVYNVMGDTNTFQVKNGKLVAKNGNFCVVVPTTATTTTTIPASTNNLLGNSIMDYSFANTPWTAPWEVVGEGGWGYSFRGDHRDHWYDAMYGTPGVENAIQQTVSNLVQGATYEIQFQLMNSYNHAVNGFWPYIGGTKGSFVNAVNGVYTQRVVAGSTKIVAIWYEDGAFSDADCLIDNAYMYYVSGP